TLDANPQLEGRAFRDDEFLCGPRSKELALQDEDVSYDGHIAKVIESRCLACHFEGGTPPDLSTYDLVVMSADASLQEIESGTMPPPPAAMDDTDKTLFRAWFEQ